MDYVLMGSWLLVSCYSDQPPDDVFATACDVARDHGALPEPYAIALPRGVNYDFLHYVEDEQRELTTLPDVERVAAGRDPALYAAQAYFRHPRFGIMMVDRSSRFGYGRHAVAIVMESDLLGVPDDMWHGKDRKRAVRIGAWLTDVLSDLTARTDALYGGVAEEGILRVPEELVAGERLYANAFVSSRLLAVQPQLPQQLAALYPASGIRTWDHGTFYAHWAPFLPNGRSTPYDPERTSKSTEAFVGALQEHYRREGRPIDARQTRERIAAAMKDV